MTPIDPTARNGIDLDAVTTETLAAACRTAAVSSAHADLLNAVAARMLAMLSWIEGAKVDLDGYDDARAAIAAVREACVGVEDCDYATTVVANVLAALDVRHDPSATTDGGAS